MNGELKRTERRQSAGKSLQRVRGRAGWFALLAGIALAGCVPRYLEKTPFAALNYPHLPVTPQELAEAKNFLAGHPRGPRAQEARFWIAQAAFNGGRWGEAEKGFRELGGATPATEWTLAAGLMHARALVPLKKPLAALAQLQKVMRIQIPGLDPGPAAREAARQIINDELTLEELAQVQKSYPDTEWEQQALAVSGKRQLDAGNPDLAVGAFAQLLSRFPQSSFAPLARELSEKAGRLVPVNRNRIGALLPLTGPFAAYGATLRQGLELALSEINQNRSAADRLELAVQDSGGTTAGAVAALEQLAAGDKVMAVIGPALSNEAEAVAPLLERRRLTAITPSAAEPGLPRLSPYLFRYLFTNEMQGQAMAEFAVQRRGVKRFGILNGEDRYDRSLAEAFTAALQKQGGQVLARQEYRPGTTDFKSQLMKLGGVDPGRMKDLELEERKALETVLEGVAYAFARRIAPLAQAAAAQRVEKTTPTPTPIPEKRAAILRFLEPDNPDPEPPLGKMITERFSYALAAKRGLKVATQKETLKALKAAGITWKDFKDDQTSLLAENLGSDAVITGTILRKPAAGPVPAGEPVPQDYEITLRLLGPDGNEWTRQTNTWTQSQAPQTNIQSLDAMYLPVPPTDAIFIASQLPFYDLRVPIFGCDAWLDSRLVRQGGEVLDGAVFASGFWPDNPEVRNANFVKHFEETYSLTPTALAVQAYDAFWLAATVLQQLPAAAGRDDFLEQLLRQRGVPRVTGTASVDADHEIRRAPFFLQLKQGKIQAAE